MSPPLGLFLAGVQCCSGCVPVGAAAGLLTYITSPLGTGLVGSWL
jgi:hypothetical protein